MSTTTACSNGATTPSRRPAGQQPSPQSDASTSSQGSDADLGPTADVNQRRLVLRPRVEAITRTKRVTRSVSAASTTAAVAAVASDKVDHVCVMNGLEVLRWLGMHDKCNVELVPPADHLSPTLPPLQGFLSDVGFRFGGRLVRMAVTKAEKATSVEAAARWLQDQLPLESEDEALHIVRTAREKLANEKLCSCERDVLQSECAQLHDNKPDPPLHPNNREWHSVEKCMANNEWWHFNGELDDVQTAVAFLTAPTSAGGVGLSRESQLIKHLQQDEKAQHEIYFIVHDLSWSSGVHRLQICKYTSPNLPEVLVDMSSGRATAINELRLDCGATLEEALRVADTVQYSIQQSPLMRVVVNDDDDDDVDGTGLGGDEDGTGDGDDDGGHKAKRSSCGDNNVVRMRTGADDEDDDEGDDMDDVVRRDDSEPQQSGEMSTNESSSVGDKRKAEDDGCAPGVKRQRTTSSEEKEATSDVQQRPRRTATGAKKRAFHVLHFLTSKVEGAQLVLLRDALTGALCIARSGVEQAEWDVWSRLLRLGDAEEHGIVPVLGRVRHHKLGRVIVMPMLREFRSMVVNRCNEQKVARQLCAAVAYLHDNLVLHGNLSVRNILTNRDGSRFFLTDFSSSVALAPQGASGSAARYRAGGWTFPYASKNRMQEAQNDEASSAGDGGEGEHGGKARAADDWHALAVVGRQMGTYCMREDVSHWRAELAFDEQLQPSGSALIVAFARDRLKAANEDETSHPAMRGELPWDEKKKRKKKKKNKKGMNKKKNKKNKKKNKMNKNRKKKNNNNNIKRDKAQVVE